MRHRGHRVTADYRHLGDKFFDLLSRVNIQYLSSVSAFYELAGRDFGAIVMLRKPDSEAAHHAKAAGPRIIVGATVVRLPFKKRRCRDVMEPVFITVSRELAQDLFIK